MPLVRTCAVEEAGDGVEFVREGTRVRPSDATRHFIQTGLTEPNSRYRSEFRVALAAVLAPEVLQPFGLVAENDDENFARAVARWLAEKHNGLSEEWYLSLGADSHDAAVAKWTVRYLTRSAATG